MIFKIFNKTGFSKIIFLFFLMLFFMSPINAQTKNSEKGDVTGLPIPRFVSAKSNKVNVRRGPNATYQIDWVYTRAGVPFKIIAEYGNWRQVEDSQGEGGWVHSRLLSGKRFIVTIEDEVILKRKPNQKSPAVATIQKGVIGKLVTIAGNWAQISVDGYSGWVLQKSVWGTKKKMPKN